MQFEEMWFGHKRYVLPLRCGLRKQLQNWSRTVRNETKMVVLFGDLHGQLFNLLAHLQNANTHLSKSHSEPRTIKDLKSKNTDVSSHLSLASLSFTRTRIGGYICSGLSSFGMRMVLLMLLMVLILMLLMIKLVVLSISNIKISTISSIKSTIRMIVNR